MESFPRSGLKVGWIGTGIMGKSMCRHLLAKGYDLSVFNRTKSKTDELVELGANYRSIRDIGTTCDAVFMIVGHPKDVEELVYETDGGLSNLMKPGSFLVDHTTSSPSLAVKIAQTMKERNVQSFDAPVSGGDVGAENAQLVVMCGGEEDGFARVSEIIKVYSKSVGHFGPPGSGQSTKMVNQIVITGQIIGMSESLVFAHKAGLDLVQALQTISGGAAGCFSLTTYGPRILKGNFEPGGFVEYYVKDLEIALDECRRMSISLPGLSLVHQLYRGLMAQGGGKLGLHALIKVIENLNNTKLPIITA